VFGVVWLGIFGCLGVMIILGLADVRLTWKLHQQRREGRMPGVPKSDGDDQERS
jgi:hypothetical protein